MKILAIDTTAKTATVALCEDEKLLSLYSQYNLMTHSETILPMVETMLKNCALSPSDIDLFACSRGPGSFTGVRIGAATVKGLAFSQNRPCVGVSTLEALALQFADLGVGEAIICPVMDARRSQVYNALFMLKNGRLERLCEDRAISLEELSAELSSYSAPIYLTGDGYELAKSELALDGIKDTPLLMRSQNAYSVALAALFRARLGITENDIDLLPSYLRASQAERDQNKS